MKTEHFGISSDWAAVWVHLKRVCGPQMLLPLRTFITFEIEELYSHNSQRFRSVIGPNKYFKQPCRTEFRHSVRNIWAIRVCLRRFPRLPYRRLQFTMLKWICYTLLLSTLHQRNHKNPQDCANSIQGTDSLWNVRIMLCLPLTWMTW
jgi:hypothetical protein